MASVTRGLARRVGPLLAGTRATTSANQYLARSKPWVCRQCAHKVVIPARRAYSSAAAAAAAVPSADSSLNAVPDAAETATTYTALDTFARRHIGPDEKDTQEMLKHLSPAVGTLDEFVAQVIPADIFAKRALELETGNKGMTESELLNFVHKELKPQNKITKSFIGAGYYGTHTPGVIQRNVLENPAWYTSYTPYQPEISQGRLESLLNYQTMVTDLTGLPIANASLLDEGTAAAEAMTMSMNALASSRSNREGKTFVVSDTLHPQTISVIHGRADGFGIKILVKDMTAESTAQEIEALGEDLVGVMVQYPDTHGQVEDYKALADLVHKQGALLSVATDLLALTMLKPPGEWGADIAFGNAQRFGVPMGYGGPHAAFFAVTDAQKRKIPGRIIGVSKDRLGGRALRLALQTREQHIRREKATSNVCTAQALLANMSALYGIYHGPEGLKAIAERTVRGARALQAGLELYGYETKKGKGSSGLVLFDTIVVELKDNATRDDIIEKAHTVGYTLRSVGSTAIGISVDETTTIEELEAILGTFRSAAGQTNVAADHDHTVLTQQLESLSGPLDIPQSLLRTSSFMTHPVFNTHHSETELLRYIYHLQAKDLSLVHSMIPLGSCTMKLNATTEMALISIPEFSNMHPYTPVKDVAGYDAMFNQLKKQLANITGMHSTSVQPNSGAQGEFAGLRAIRLFHEKNPHGKKRDICLIPVSAHGTNPASAAMAGMRVVPVKCDVKTGNLDLADLEAKCQKYQEELGAIMVTYPSTFGVFEPQIRKVCDLVHQYGGQVYMDGANMNAQIGLCSPGDIGADVCHLNLHKTFCIPHGGGGPGVGPICVKEHLADCLPTENLAEAEAGATNAHPVASAKYGSASINLISWAYNSLMGADGLTHATKITLLNANYLLSRLKPHYEILYTNDHGRCAHEFILDVRPFSKTAGVEAIDIAKRLQDYGFHAPTMSWPVANTLMIEPTESESKEELDRFVDALISIRQEIREVEEGKVPKLGNVLKHAPHPIQDIVEGDGEGKWERSYSRAKAAYPLPYLREKKFWPSVGRVDDKFGDLNLFCTCPPVVDTTGDEN